MGWNFGQTLQYIGIKSTSDGISLLAVLPVFRAFLKLSDAGLGIMGGLSRSAFFIYFGFIIASKQVYWGEYFFGEL